MHSSRSCLAFKQWWVKAAMSAAAHCASSFLFVAEWSWQQAQAGSGLQHTACQSTYCFCSWPIFPVQPNYTSITESCDSHTFHHLGGPGRAAWPWHGCPVPSPPRVHHGLGISLVSLGTERVLFLTGAVWSPDQVRYYVSILLSQDCFGYSGSLCFHMNCEIFCSGSVKNAIGNLMGIALNL